ncbi:MAG: carboxypeptidase-like regulatory domain-containing protein [Flavobacterium sp.]|uniref:carboxypeptidase-like regulatory domain-containing protein n=1 Tax=Flavobacterium sp. TaxID=239 RepID=UPI00122086D8|nr:carboxypeptidase-like regulatory domain-containing protein [Flavobacterium sp.]RZJ65649.1 MAG: carboxypeptidase-like regulatory domain-containing protein [Flavobacterium sp.]
MVRLLFLLLVPMLCHAQQYVHGKIIDARTKTPLDGANIFISQTTFAAITDAEGRFTIEVPDNNYKLLVSYVGYEQIVLGPETFTDRLARYTIELHENEQRLRELVIMSKKEREKYLALFLEHLIGTSRNAQKTKLLNPDDILFKFDKETQILNAWADVPLKIEIPELNYKLKFILADFNLDLPKRVSYYTGYASYAELDAAKANSKKTVANRSRAFYGSSMHFIRTLYSRQLASSGFTVRPFTKKINPAWPGDSLVSAMYREAQTTNDYTKMRKLPKREIVTLGERAWYEQDFISSIENRLLLSIPDFIEVSFSNEIPEHNYPSQNPLSRQQFSQIRLNGTSVEIFADGSLSNPDALVFYGYMGWEKLADTLPFDYNP